MKDELIRELLQGTIRQYSIDEVTNRHAEALARNITEDQVNELRRLMISAHECGFVDGFKFGIKFASELVD